MGRAVAASKNVATEALGPSSPALATPDYWADACKHLMKKDRVMKRLIPQFGDAALQTRGDAFTTLARSIVGQQISVKAAQTVWERFAALPRTMKPGNVLKLKIDDMRAAGLSARKVDYLVDLAVHFDAGKLHVKDWAAMDDEAIIAELVAIRGIGRWTAEMFLIFYLMRPNVLPLDDVGLITGRLHVINHPLKTVAEKKARHIVEMPLTAVDKLGAIALLFEQLRQGEKSGLALVQFDHGAGLRRCKAGHHSFDASDRAGAGGIELLE